MRPGSPEAAARATALVAIDPAGLGGIVLRARHGPARQALLKSIERLAGQQLPVRRLPIGIADDRLIGGLDLAATLQAGKPMAMRGILTETDGGILVAAMAERMQAATAARLCAVLDTGEVVVERDGFAARYPSRFGVVALDEGIEAEESPPAALRERLAIWLTLDEGTATEVVFDRGDVLAARNRLQGIEGADIAIEALSGAALALGIATLRAPLFAIALARANAAFEGRRSISDEDLEIAAALVFAPRATRLPASEEDQQADPPSPPPSDDKGKEDGRDPNETQRLEDLVVEATRAAIPEALLAGLAKATRERARSSGGAGASSPSLKRGRPIGSRRGDPARGARLALVETLRAAAPWQPIRRKPGETRVMVSRNDFRIQRFKQEAETMTLFVVDASGSAALHRLAEAKGAVERLLADCYIRRDRVAVIAFRGDKAEVLLPPTRSLVRAKRSLSALPGGGGTPLSTAIDCANLTVREAVRRGATAVTIFLTDGKANVDRSGIADRVKANEDALASAKLFALSGSRTLLVDTSPRPQPQARAIAEAMRATYLPLPHANAATLDLAVRQAAA